MNINTKTTKNSDNRILRRPSELLNLANDSFSNRFGLKNDLVSATVPVAISTKKDARIFNKMDKIKVGEKVSCGRTVGIGRLS